jgi:hypothetical protein
MDKLTSCFLHDLPASGFRMLRSVVCADEAWNVELARQMYCWSENLLMNGPIVLIPQNDETVVNSTKTLGKESKISTTSTLTRYSAYIWPTENKPRAVDLAKTDPRNLPKV